MFCSCFIFDVAHRYLLSFPTRRSSDLGTGGPEVLEVREVPTPEPRGDQVRVRVRACALNRADLMQSRGLYPAPPGAPADIPDRKSTRLNSSHTVISYAVFCLKKKTIQI